MDASHRDSQNRKKEAGRTLVHDAAHDLNNVMMTIAGSAELLLESAGDNQKLRLWAEHILHASKEGMVLVDHLKTPENTPHPKGPARAKGPFGQGKVPA